MPNENESKRDATSQPAWPAVQSSATKEIGVPALHRSWASVKESRINPPGGLLPPPSPGQNTYKGTQALNPRGRAFTKAPSVSYTWCRTALDDQQSISAGGSTTTGGPKAYLNGSGRVQRPLRTGSYYS